MKVQSILVASMVFFIGCQGLDTQINVIGNYYLVAADLPDQMALSYHDKSNGPNYPIIVDATVFAVWHDNNYIIVKQHPRENMNPPNNSITNYYILPLKDAMDYNTHNGLIGPISKLQFADTCRFLGIDSNVKFKVVVN